MHRSFLLIPAIAALASAGCVVGGASGAPYAETQRHTYTGFQKVDVSAGIDVIVSQGNFDVKAETTDGGDFKNLVVEVRGDTLHIGRNHSMFNWGGGPRYRVTVSAPSYSRFEVSSGASLDGSGLQLADLRVEVSSGARLELSGSCTTLNADLSSGAQFDGESLKCDAADVDASSGARADAFASNSANASASSGANVTFHGNPATLEKDTSSGGSVDAR